MCCIHQVSFLCSSIPEHLHCFHVCLLWIRLQLTWMCQCPFEFLISILLSLFWEMRFKLFEAPPQGFTKGLYQIKFTPTDTQGFLFINALTFIVYFWIVSILTGVSNFSLWFLVSIMLSDIEHHISALLLEWNTWGWVLMRGRVLFRLQFERLKIQTAWHYTYTNLSILYLILIVT